MGETANGELSWSTRIGEAGTGEETARDLVRARKPPTLMILWLLGVLFKSDLPLVREIGPYGGEEDGEDVEL